MQLSRALTRLAWLLLPLALGSTSWLYLYPLLHNCAFPQPSPTSLPLHASRAPFRLLALGDPQLEGDSSLPDPSAPVFPSLQHVLEDMRHANYDAPDVRDILIAAVRGGLGDAAVWLEGHRKALDLWGNDLYLAHIVRCLRWWTEPTHIAVLGDLLGSQWITEGEFAARGRRYWGTVMRGLEKVPDAVMGGAFVESDHYDEPQFERQKTWGGTTEVLGEDPAWARRVINIAGNHDIGYAGDIDEARVERFERAFGSVNWDLWLTLNTTGRTNTTDTDTDDTSNTDTTSTPALRLVILNSMNLDTPAYTSPLQTDTYAFLNHIITTSRPVTDKTHATILLTHIPLHKPPGLCVDDPYFAFFDSGHGIKEQNMLSPHGSKIVLESIFGLSPNRLAEGAGMGRHGVILNGHDHAGCDIVHYTHQPLSEPCNTTSIPAAQTYHVPAPNSTDDETAWIAQRHPALPYSIAPDNTCTHVPSAPHMREITLRSMMGDYSGYAGFLSAWYDGEKGEEGEWVVQFSSCGVGVQHWWWGVHIIDLILLLAAAGALVARAVEAARGESVAGVRMVEEVVKKAKGKEETDVVKHTEKVVELSVQPGAKSLATTTTVKS